MSTVPNVYACIAAVSAEIAQTGIAKDRKNAQQGYQFRGIDDVYNALAPILAKHKLVILPRILNRVLVERESKAGGSLFNVTVEAEFDFVSAVDGSAHTARTFGEAMDSADKATNKAMSAAYKYAAFQTFCIPTEGDNDADAHTPEPAGRPAPPRQPSQAGASPRPQTGNPISEAQAKRFYAIARGVGWLDEDLHMWLRERWGYASDRDIPRSQYDEIVAAAQAGPQ